MRENRFDYFGLDDALHPRIKFNKLNSREDDLVKILDVDAVFDVLVEGETIAHTSDFLKAFGVLVACFYVFNAEYPTHLSKSLFWKLGTVPSFYHVCLAL